MVKVLGDNMEQILLLSDIGRKANMACEIKFDAKSGTYVKKCAKKKKKRGILGDIGDLGAGADGRVARAKGFLTFAGINIPTLLYAGGLGAVGALGAKYAWNVLLNPVDKTGKYAVIDTSKNTNIKAFAEIVTGGGIGFIVMKLLKQPKLGAALMIGPVVVGIMDLLKPMLPANVQKVMTGLPDIRTVRNRSYDAASRLPVNIKEVAGVTTVGRSIPKWTRYPGRVMSSIPV
jgi:hypothetical protein